MSEKSERETLRKLDQILRVLSAQAAYQSSLTERARLLKMAGLDNATIAEVLNTTQGTIRVMTSHLRKES